MIINSTEITENGVTFNQINNGGSDYYYCVYDGTTCINTSQGPITEMQGEEEVEIEPALPVRGKTSTLDEIFGADTWDNLQKEMEVRGIS